jgi:hypothetical protein
MSFNESTANKKFYLDVAWGAKKTMFLEKFSFGDEFFYSEPLVIDGSKGMFVKNPVYIYPVQRETDSNPAAKALNDFYYSGSLFPSCSIGVKLTDGRQVRDILQYKFINVRVLERYGGGGDRRLSYYLIRFDNWTTR